MFPFTKQGWVPEGQEGPNDWAAIGWPADELANSYAIPFDAAPSELPEEYRIGQIYPTPFNEQATVEIALPTNAVLTVALYDVLGRQVSEVVNGWTPAGSHQFTIDASQLTSGVYFLRAEAGSHSATQKVALIR